MAGVFFAHFGSGQAPLALLHNATLWHIPSPNDFLFTTKMPTISISCTSGSPSKGFSACGNLHKQGFSSCP